MAPLLCAAIRLLVETTLSVSDLHLILRAKTGLFCSLLYSVASVGFVSGVVDCVVISPTTQSPRLDCVVECMSCVNKALSNFAFPALFPHLARFLFVLPVLSLPSEVLSLLSETVSCASTDWLLCHQKHNESSSDPSQHSTLSPSLCDPLDAACVGPGARLVSLLIGQVTADLIGLIRPQMMVAVAPCELLSPIYSILIVFTQLELDTSSEQT